MQALANKYEGILDSLVLNSTEYCEAVVNVEVVMLMVNTVG